MFRARRTSSTLSIRPSRAAANLPELWHVEAPSQAASLAVAMSGMSHGASPSILSASSVRLMGAPRSDEDVARPQIAINQASPAPQARKAAAGAEKEKTGSPP